MIVPIKVSSGIAISADPSACERYKSPRRYLGLGLGLARLGRVFGRILDVAWPCLATCAHFCRVLYRFVLFLLRFSIDFGGPGPAIPPKSAIRITFFAYFQFRGFSCSGGS